MLPLNITSNNLHTHPTPKDQMRIYYPSSSAFLFPMTLIGELKLLHCAKHVVAIHVGRFCHCGLNQLPNENIRK